MHYSKWTLWGSAAGSIKLIVCVCELGGAVCVYVFSPVKVKWVMEMRNSIVH